ncbi:MAG: DUF58 domain-containing protein [Anaerolineae bacterium]|nr:DUF58 domain-containing protein [Anaerolineae bacterium]
MFSEAWLVLASVVLLIGFATGRAGLSALGILLLTVVGLASCWSRLALRGVHYARRLSERRAFLGETLTLELTAANRKLLPLAWLQIEDELPQDLAVLDSEVLPSAQPSVGLLTSLLSLRWRERARWQVRLRCDRRGYYYLGPAHLSSGDGFGLFRCQQTLPRQDVLVVYPRLYALEALGLPSKEPFGDARARVHIMEDPNRAAGVRDYDAADPLKRVHWKATARRQQLQTRVYEPTVHLQLLICLNLLTLAHEWEGSIPELLEQAISVAASLASHGVEHRYEVGLLANGCWPLSDQPLKVLPGRSPYQLARILEALAAVSPLPTSRLGDLMLRESARLPWGATLAVVTAVLGEDLVESMLRLTGAGRRVVLLSLDAARPSEEPPGILCYRLASPAGEEPIRFARVGGQP